VRLASVAEDENGSGAQGKDSGRKTTSNTAAAKCGRGIPGSGSERIEPAVPTGTDRDRFMARVESPTG
jgi:hypothetical protein